MARLQEFLEQGQAEVTAYLASPEGGYQRIASHPSADLRWDPGARVLGWWWALDDQGPHYVRADRIEDDDYQAVLYHAHGKVEVAGILFDRQREILEAWDKRKDRAWIQEMMDAGMQAMIQSPGPAPEPKLKLSTFEVVVEWRPTGPDRVRWVPVGAWAANQETWAFAALAWYAPIESEYAEIVQGVLAQGANPLEALAYWEAQAPWSTHVRQRVEPVQAQTAREAALMAASRAEEIQLQ